MARFRRKTVDSDFDKKLLTGLIVSTPYCHNVMPLLDVNYVQSDFGKRIARWIQSYYKQYKEAPVYHIKDIYEKEKSKIDEAEADLIKMFLGELSDRYDLQQPSINVHYLTDETFGYFRERGLRNMQESMGTLLEIGKVEEAEKLVREYRKIARSTSGWINPFDVKFIRKIYDKDNSLVLFRFPGALGRLIGDLKRGWLLAFMGPMKRGKSWWLQEVAILAMMVGLRVVFVSLEMGEEEVGERMHKRITTLADEEGMLVYPCFDCASNQDNSCFKKERTCRVRLLDDEGNKPEHRAGMNYKPCVVCRENGDRDYKVATWFEQHKVGKLVVPKIEKRARALVNMYGDNLRVMAYPARSANLEDVIGDLENLEFTEDFVPDVMVFDYPDIFAPEDSRQVGRERTNETWSKLKGLGQTKHALTVAASQSNRKSLKKRRVEDEDTAEDIRKLAHVDVICGLNQMDEEKSAGVMRIGMIEHRHRFFTRSDEVLVIQQLAVGHPLIDSEFI